MRSIKTTVIAIFAAISAVVSMGLGASSAFADDYGATVTASGNTVAFTIPDGTFDGNSTITFSWTSSDVSTVVDAASVIRTANAEGGYSGKIVFSSDITEATTITATGTKNGQAVTYTITAEPAATGAGGSVSAVSTGSTTAQTGAAVLPIVGGVVLLAIAGIVILAVRRQGAR